MMTKFNVNKWLNLMFILLFIPACQNKNNSNFQTENNDNCSPKNNVTLTANNVKLLNLEGESVKESGQLNQGEVMGFSFNAKAGDIFKYKTDQDLCIDIYTQKNDLVKDVKLPIDGKYTLQVYLPKGSQLFEINFSLNEDEKLAKKQNQTLSQDNPNIVNQPEENQNLSISINQNEEDIKKFIINHYQDLKARNYEKTWDELSDNFKQKSVSYSEYQKWWNSVKEINISNLNIISVSDNNAIVDVKLSYVLNNGKIFNDKKPYISLIRDPVKSTWILDNKKSN